MRRFRAVWCVLGGLGAVVVVGGTPGLLAGVVVAGVVAVLVERAETPAQRRTRALVRRDLPHLVTLLSAALRSGAAPAEAAALACAALPGPAADRLAGAVARLHVGADPVQVWERLGEDPDLGRLGRALARSQDSGAAVVPTVERLAADLAERARAETEERARAVGVKAAIPLGVCLLPAFVLVGIVPLVAGLLASLRL
nr:type II secretion system F family protein [Nocardioides panaciterrulae]